MATYVYTIADKHAQKESGRIEAASQDEAAGMVKRDGWYILSLHEEGIASSFGSLFTKKSTLSSLERILLTDHMAAMMQSGTSLVEALETFGEDESAKDLPFLSEIVNMIQQGKKLSDSMHKFPRIFSSYYCSLVAAGEMSGRLDETFMHLAKELRREYEFRERIKSALLYPSLVLIVAFCVVTLLVLLVIPKITELTKTFGGDLPLSTKIVSGISVFLTHYGLAVIIGFIAVIIGFIILLRQPRTKAVLDPYILKLPLIGKLIRYYDVARIMRLIGSCLSYGIPLTTTFDAVADVVDNRIYKEACIRMKKRVVKGMDLAQSFGLEGTFLFPAFIVRSVRGAEKTGSVDSALIRLSAFFESDVDRTLKRVTDLVEPVLTIILGLIVGSIALAVIGPIYQLTSKIH
jgi:type IV pilus assembly protein PilC